MKRFGRFIFGTFALFGLLAVGYLVFTHFDGIGDWRWKKGASRLEEVAGGAVKRVQEATMSKGLYLVQLESMEAMDQDFTRSAFTEGPKPISMKVSANGRVVANRDLGAWRGKKSFLEEPISFEIAYDPSVPITLEFYERGFVGEARTYVTTDGWPFTRTAIGEASRCSFNWKKLPEAPSPASGAP